MRLLMVVVLSGVMLLVIGACSEKQKEASRMEQEVRDLEAADDSSAAVTESVSTGESAAATEPSPESSPADPSVVPPEGTPIASPAATPTEPSEVKQDSKPQPETPKPAMPPAPAGVGYTVQIASCESEDYARHLVNVYTRRGYEPFVATISYNNLLYYRVRIGHFATVAEARTLREELADKFSIQPWIDRTE